MLIRGQTTEQRIAEIANAFKQGFDGYSAGQRRYNDAALDIQRRGDAKELRSQELQAEAARRQQAIEREEKQYNRQLERDKVTDEKSNRELGLREKEYNLKAEELSLPFEKTREYNKMKVGAQLNAEAKAEADARKQQNQLGKKTAEASIADFEIADPSIIPTTKDAETVKKLNQSNKSYQQIGTSAIEKIKKANPKNPAYYLSNDYKMLQQDLTKMKLQAKNLEDLGVLNGPDLSLVNETLGSINPTTLTLLGTEAAAERLKASLATATSVLNNAAAARNYRPKTSQQDAELAELAALRAKAGM